LKNINTFLLFIFLPVGLFAYVDKDMDGVDDVDDKCLYTPFMDIVNSEGCSTETLVSKYHFDITTGLSYGNIDYNTLSKTDTLTTSFGLTYYYENFSCSLSSSFYSNKSDDYSDSGINDTYLALDYIIFDSALYMSIGSTLILPTYDNSYGTNNLDYALNVNLGYNIGNFNYFTSYGYTWINDTDVADYVYYQDTNSLSIGLGYIFSSPLYASLAYNQSESIYKKIEQIRTASVYLFYSLSQDFFTNFSYAYGLSDTASDNYLSIKLGYKF